jgi:hypothetical protein
MRGAQLEGYKFAHNPTVCDDCRRTLSAEKANREILKDAQKMLEGVGDIVKKAEEKAVGDVKSTFGCVLVKLNAAMEKLEHVI